MAVETITQKQTLSQSKPISGIKVDKQKLAELATLAALFGAVGLCYMTIYNIIMGAF